MDVTKRLLILFSILIILSVSVGGTIILLLYPTFLEQEKNTLFELLSNQVEMIEESQFVSSHSLNDHLEGKHGASLSEIREAFRDKKFFETGEFVIAQRKKDNIVFLYTPRLYFPKALAPISWQSPMAEPMRRALNGVSGTTINTDYRGESVIAAYMPLVHLNAGIVAKIDLEEFRAPFVKTAWTAALVSLVIIVVGASIFFFISEPILRTLQRSESKLRSILNSVIDSIITIDKKGTIDSVNPAAEQMFSYRTEEMLGQNVKMLMPSPYQQEHDQYLSSYLESGKKKIIGIGREAMGLRKDGSVFPLVLGVSEVKVGEEIIFTGIIRDISAAKQHEEDLKLAIEAAEASNKAKSEFLANMSHEIRTPLNSIIGFSQVIMMDSSYANFSEDFKQYLENIKTAGENLTELINNILDLSKIEAGKLDLSEEDLNFKQLLQGVFHINKSAASEKKLLYRYEFDPALPELIHSDRNKLNQILMNLVSNAIKFTPAGKSVVLTARKDREQLLLQVQDQGIGIPEDRQAAVFAAFEQADGSTTRLYGGTGLGLTITQKMVELLSGDIEFESEEGHGSTFSVRVPLKKATEKAEAGDLEKPKHARFCKDNLILVVEDNPLNQQMITAMFKNMNLQIVLAGNGEEGIGAVLEMQKTGKLPDLILMDMHMPGIDGLATTQKLHQNEGLADIPIVALSAEAFSEQQKQAHEIGISAYLTKPIDLKKLYGVLGRYLRKETEPQQDPQAGVPSRPPLPDTVEEQIRHEWQELAQLPVYFVDEIIELAEKIRALAEGYHSAYPEILEAITEAVYKGDEVRFRELVHAQQKTKEL
ncbi:MAG: PAS domain S-box protein [SAR324 cluster bacterium]|nr:PAS domain S-box protein [SAR324 cluster bacterium]